jgi:hypothetical protein
VTQKRDQRRRSVRRTQGGTRVTTTKIQLALACGMLGMLLLLGPSFSSSAAGCFHSMSASEVTPPLKRATPPTTSARMSDSAEEHEGGDVTEESETAISHPSDIPPP